MRICISGEVLLRYPRQFCRLAQALTDNAEEIYVLTFVTERTGDQLFRQIQNLFVPTVVSSFVVYNNALDVPDLSLSYGIEHEIDIFFVDDTKVAQYIKKRSDIIVMECL